MPTASVGAISETLKILHYGANRISMPDQSNPENRPRTIQDIITTIESKSADGVYIYRGERELHNERPHYGKVSSNLWRKYGIDDEWFNIELIQTEMLNAAKKHIGQLPQDFRVDSTTFQNMSGADTTETIDFEILTEIQHYEGKTNLIDFSTDYFIALFFACDGSPDKDGRVILQKTDPINHWIKHPQNPRHRVIAQKSVFVRPPRGFIEPQENDIVLIPKNLKQPMLQHLQKYHSISTESIYNDLHGFIRNQDIHEGAYMYFYKGFACQERADKATTADQKREENKRAIEHYTKAIELKSDLPEAYNNLGNVYRENSDFDRAITDFDIAIRLKPDFAAAYNNRGLAYKEKGDFDRAIEDFDIAIRLKPDFAAAYNNRGLAYKEKGDFDRAITDFDTAIQLEPNLIEAYNNRGNAYAKKGDFDRAITDYDTAIQLEPNLIEAYNNRGNVYAKKGDFDRAIEDFDIAIRRKPDYAAAYNNRGNAYKEKGDFDTAIKDYNTAIKLDPDFAEPYNNRGLVYVKKGNLDHAITDFDTAIQLEPNHFEAYNNCGSVYAIKGDYDRAIEDYNKAIQLNPNFTTAHNNLNMALRNRKKRDQN